MATVQPHWMRQLQDLQPHPMRRKFSRTQTLFNLEKHCNEREDSQSLDLLEFSLLTRVLSCCVFYK